MGAASDELRLSGLLGGLNFEPYTPQFDIHGRDRHVRQLPLVASVARSTPPWNFLLFQNCANESQPPPPPPVLPGVFAFRSLDFPPPGQSQNNPSFPPPEEFAGTQSGYTHMPKVPNPTGMDEHGKTIRASPAEAVLNWQTENAFAQNGSARVNGYKAIYCAAPT
ncbi:hypothetical protein NL676_027961 [Syzygium grande]|nr:hypothetical protein NL676_027961 [Syzygium grande]